ALGGGDADHVGQSLRAAYGHQRLFGLSPRDVPHDSRGSRADGSAGGNERRESDPGRVTVRGATVRVRRAAAGMAATPPLRESASQAASPAQHTSRWWIPKKALPFLAPVHLLVLGVIVIPAFYVIWL